MAVICLGVDDEPSASSDRAYLERNSIGILCGQTGTIDLPSENWLGRFSTSSEIRNSGLWNKDFIALQYDHHFLDVMEAYVQAALGRRPAPTQPLAPVNWYSKKPSKDASEQLSFHFDNASKSK